VPAERDGWYAARVVVDWGKAAEDYGRYRVGYRPELFDRLAGLGLVRPGQRVLDLGTGPGTLARDLALHGCAVVGLDPSLEALEQARRLDRGAGVVVSYLVGRAEDVGLAAGRFDVVTAGTAWQWFDRRRAAGEARRLIVGGGGLVLTRFIPLPLPGSVVELTWRLAARHNPDPRFAAPAADTGIHPEWVPDVEEAGFREIETFSFDSAVPYSHEAWCGRARASSAVGASLRSEQVDRFTAELRDLLARSYPREPLEVRHRTFALVCRAP
jgi:SAM-dependent methyltransferase